MNTHQVAIHRHGLGKLLDGLRLRCPACGRGRLYDGFRMHRTCAVCEVVFERDAGQFTGAVYINLIITQFSCLLLFVLLEMRYHLSTLQEIGVCAVWAVAVASLLHRHTKGFFIAIVHSQVPLRPDPVPVVPPEEPGAP